MNLHKQAASFLFLVFILLAPFVGRTQITSVADAVVSTEYSGGSQDNIYIFCGAKGDRKAYLTATEPNGETASFEWTKYNSSTGSFDFHISESGNSSSTIPDLENGCYRVKITSTSGENTYTAWVFNNFIEATAVIPESDCTSFLLEGSFESPSLVYTDLSNGQPLELTKDIKVEWREGQSVFSRIVSYRNYAPPTKDTNYTFEVSDRFGCKGQANVTYVSVVTKASFEFTIPDQRSDKPEKKEAPLSVTFTNTSENGDPGKYEWFIFKDLQKIKDEKEAGTFKDSIMDVIYNDSPVYTFEETGEYKVKLVSKHVSEFNTCTDTFYRPENIIIEASFLDAPNVFTPNGDGINDKYAIKFFSMKSVKITIFNRWGKILHKWESNNVRGFFNTASPEGENYDVQSVWDGKVGGKLATPGVYYYVAEGIGRDGKKKKANGFFHLFRDK
jgi:gliding motility-associated-like protein